MTNRSRLVSGRVPTSNSANVTSDRYQFLDLSSAEPNLGAANTGDILSYNSDYPGGRQWISSSTLVSGNTQQIFDKANSANVLAQAAYNQANNASANTIVLTAANIAQNANISIALAGVEAANSNISFLTGFSQGAYNKANAANVLAQAAFDKANLAASSTYTQAAYDKANSANVLAQAAYDNSNTKFSSSGGNITGDVTIINNKNLTVTGNLTVQGNLISTNTQSFTVADPLIVLGLGNYISDLKDIGFVSHYNDGVNAHAGFFRDSTTKDWYLFKGYVPEVDANNNITITDPTFRTDNLIASIVKANLIGTTAVVNNIELGAFTQAAYNFANSANVLAQAAYNAANAAGSSTYVQGAYNQANSANVLAQAAYNQANTAGANTIVLTAANIAQNANIAIALAGLTAANANIAIAQAGVVAANSNISYLINTFVPAAYNAANTAQLQAIGAFGFAQASYNQANSALGIALSAGIQANVANSIANTALQNTASIVTAGNLTVSNNLTVTNNVTAASIITTGIGGSISGANTVSANTLNVLNAIITSNTASTSNTTGALLVTGGVGIQGNLYATAVYSNNRIVLTSEPIGQGAYDKANAANVLAQAAFDYANASSGGAVAQAAFNKANSANVLAQAAFNAANAAVQSSGGTITGTLNVANIIETGKTITVAANTTWNTNPQLANSGIVVGALTYKSNSIYFDGASDSLTLSPGITIGSNRYTVEFWMYLLDNNITSTLGIIGTNTTNAFNLRLNSNTEIQIDKSFASNQLFTIPTLQANTWYHVAAVRDVSNRETVFINGIRSSTGFVTDSSNFSGPTNAIAADITTANYTPYLSNIRIVTNNNLYDPTQSSVTVPTGILGTVTGTQYLGAIYGASYDASGNQTITVNGAARAELFSPFYNPPVINLLYDGANNWLTYGGINAASFYSNGTNVLNFAKAAFDFANSISGGSAADSYARAVANTTAIVANSTAIVANIVAAGLVSTNTNTAIALAGVVAANANISFLTGFTQGAYNKANAALPNTGSLITVNSVSQVYISNTSQTALTIAGGANIVGNLITSYITASGNVLPSIDNAYYLGQPGQRWHSLYVGPGSVDIGGIVLSNTGGSLSISASDIQIIPPAGQAPLPSFGYTANVANSAQANTIVTQAVDVSQNANIAIALAGVAAANSNIIALYAVNIAQNANISIAQAGVVAANANISFLTGFSQGAYDKANTTATVANSTAVVANIVAAGLVATNTNTAIALAGVAAANSNISFLTGFSQAAFNKANTANVKYTESNTYPVTANVGDQWYDSSTDILFEYVTANGSSFWIDQSSAAISTQAGYNVNVSGLPVRTTFSISTPSIANNTTANVAVNTYKTYVLSKVLTNAAAWVRIYTDGTSRTNDAGRSVGNDPLAGSGVVAEILNTTGTTQLITPGVIGFNNDATVNNNTYLAVTNLSGSTQVITVTMTMLQFE
jgi:hypothetical protein